MGIICLFATACQQHHAPVPVIAPTSVSPALNDTFATNRIIPSVSLLNSPDEGYALFLPDNYSDTSKLPVIIFFDPHAGGTVPLNLYSGLANEFGVILMGSNSSKNDLDFSTTTAIANHLVAEAKTRFRVNAGDITLAGFSGGAKVALVAAAANADVKNVVYCGAATPVQIAHALTLIGFAGTSDMNYTDVVAFDTELKNLNAPHYLIEWEGKHEFPTAKIFKDVFLFITTGNIPEYEKKQVTVSREKLAQEQSAKQQLIAAFQSQNLDWWKSQIQQMEKAKKQDVMYSRLLGFISLACYSLSRQTLQQNNLTAAEKILAIYRLADPDNKDMESFTKELKQKKANR